MSKRAGKVEDSSTKKLKVQIGICKRMIKEVESYKIEVTRNEARIQKMRDDGKDPYDIRKQEEVLQESYMMVPDSTTRMEQTLEELSSLLDEYAEDVELDEALKEEARALLALVSS
eukprot:gene4658-6545_t